MKIIAYYLPQFHEIPENNVWWGEGFTEWTNVKAAKPLFKFHTQPKVPLEGYYDLTDRRTMQHQAELAMKYGIDGMAFYHYWFEGRLLLEKPAEQLLQWNDIPMNFMFVWANHDWVKNEKGHKKILMQQTYGNRDDWERHFLYLLPFFLDRRYIRIENKPAVGFYLAKNIPDFNEMIQFWKKLAENNGLDGLYIIDSINNAERYSIMQSSDAVVLRQPNAASYNATKLYRKLVRRPSVQKWIPFCYPGRISYKTVMDELIRQSEGFQCEKKVFYGFFSGWDNTARHGRRGYVMTGQTCEQFRKYFWKLVCLAKKNHIDYIFINAWNEWAEGMYLEPDQKNGFHFLEGIREVLDSGEKICL